ncbi:MAG: hypothetical protein CL932_12090 [Deltaproteobacteria bacterium]|nr:hypothetical protein [Deltaproteobacteria bacterium]|tara:strand:+ start:249 stop:458 length:210 start_codon:yes stop_codon:yes gene_type:complete
MFGCILRGHKYNCPWIRFENIVWIMGDWGEEGGEEKDRKCSVKIPYNVLETDFDPWCDVAYMYLLETLY